MQLTLFFNKWKGEDKTQSMKKLFAPNNLPLRMEDAIKLLRCVCIALISIRIVRKEVLWIPVLYVLQYLYSVTYY